MNGDVGSLPISNLTNQDYVWILANHGAQCPGERKIDLGVHLHLTDAVQLIFDWILNGENVLVRRVNVAKSCIQGGGLTASRRSSHQDDSMRKMKQPFHLRQGRACETNLFHAEKFAAFFQQPEHNSLAKSSGQTRNPYVHQTLADLNLRAAVLG